MDRTSMDHATAVNSQACEKYVLGELSSELRDAFEEHYFSCAECAAQLRSATEFLAGSRDILGSEPATVRGEKLSSPHGWMAWLRPTVAIPVFAVLLAIIGYQNFVTIPHWKQSAAGPRVLPMYSLISANTRGDQALVFTVPSDQPFGLYIDVPADAVYNKYLLRLEGPAGTSTPLRSLSAAEAQKTQVVIINPGRLAGVYSIVVSGLTSPANDPSLAKELARLQFSVVLKD